MLKAALEKAGTASLLTRKKGLENNWLQKFSSKKKS